MHHPIQCSLLCTLIWLGMWSITSYIFIIPTIKARVRKLISYPTLEGLGSVLSSANNKQKRWNKTAEMQLNNVRTLQQSGWRTQKNKDSEKFTTRTLKMCLFYSSIPHKIVFGILVSVFISICWQFWNKWCNTVHTLLSVTVFWTITSVCCTHYLQKFSKKGQNQSSMGQAPKSWILHFPWCNQQQVDMYSWSVSVKLASSL